jgi:hypothetical protein
MTFSAPKLVGVCLISILLGPATAFAQTPEELYEAKCGRCHAPYAADSYAAEDWPGIVRSMRSQAALTEEEEALLTDYLVSLAGGSEGEKSTSEGPVLGGYLYTEYFRDQQRAKNFDLHYLAFSVSGWASDRIQYFAEFELEHGGTGGDNTFVEQAYIDFWFNNNLGVKIGGILTPFNRFDELHGPLSNFTISRPQVAREIGVSAWKDVGVVVHGFKTLSNDLSVAFDAYTINGLGDGSNLRGSRQYRDNNEDRAMGGRVNLLFRDMVEVGGSAYRGAWDDEGDYDLTMFGGFIMVQTAFADLWGEYSKAETENPSPDADGDMSGYFFQASRLFEDKFRPTIRIGSLDYLDPGSQLGRNPSRGDKDLTEVVFSFAYYPTSKVVLKAEYILFGEGARAEEVDNDLFGLQAAVRF